MNSFALALASIAFVLINLGIGWALAKGHCRYSQADTSRSLPTTRSTSDAVVASSLVGKPTEDGALMNGSKGEPAKLSITTAAVS
jgi:hypothetical protein